MPLGCLQMQVRGGVGGQRKVIKDAGEGQALKGANRCAGLGLGVCWFRFRGHSARWLGWSWLGGGWLGGRLTCRHTHTYIHKPPTHARTSTAMYGHTNSLQIYPVTYTHTPHAHTGPPHTYTHTSPPYTAHTRSSPPRPPPDSSRDCRLGQAAPPPDSSRDCRLGQAAKALGGSVGSPGFCRSCRASSSCMPPGCAGRGQACRPQELRDSWRSWTKDRRASGGRKAICNTTTGGRPGGDTK